MKILFVYPWPKKPKNSFYLSKLKWKLFSTIASSSDDLVCQTIAAITPKNHTIQMVDEAAEEIDFNADVDLVAITSLTVSAPRAYEIADQFRKNGKKVVIGGWHATALPDEAKQHADSIIIGEGEETFPALLNDFENNKMKPFYEQQQPADLNRVPILSKEERMKYKSGPFSQSIQISKGCPVGCNFCAISYRKFGNIHRARSVENVVKELETIPQRIISFADPSLTINPKYTKQLFKAIKPLNKVFGCEGNANILGKDEELLKLAAEAGCISWYVGFESVNQDTINSIGKSTNIVTNYKSIIKKIHDYGMRVEGAFIFGFDTDKTDIFDNTINTIKDWELDLIDISILTPYPGTPLFNQLEKENRILTKNWELYDSIHVVHKPKQMTPEELLNGVQKVWDGLYPEIFTMKRVLRARILGLNAFVTSALRNYLYYKRSKKALKIKDNLN